MKTKGKEVYVELNLFYVFRLIFDNPVILRLLCVVDETY
jgi:hypothetical protein